MLVVIRLVKRGVRCLEYERWLINVFSERMGKDL